MQKTEDVMVHILLLRLERRGLERIKEEQGRVKGKLRGEGGSEKTLGYFMLKRDGDTMSFIRKKGRETRAQ